MSREARSYGAQYRKELLSKTTSFRCGQVLKVGKEAHGTVEMQIAWGPDEEDRRQAVVKFTERPSNRVKKWKKWTIAEAKDVEVGAVVMRQITSREGSTPKVTYQFYPSKTRGRST